MSKKKTTSKPLTTFTYEQVLSSCMNYFDGDELAATTWMNKYAMKDDKSQFIERSPEDMHHRMAREFYKAECKYKKKAKTHLSDYGQQRKALSEESIFEYFREFRYLVPQGSVMSVLGNEHVVASLSNCIVLPEIYDSYGGIFYTDQQMAQLFKRRCGVGIDISTLRPAGMPVSNSAGTTTGAVSFMERFSNTTREVSQNGRRGALMITMDIAHPDVERFITVKQDLRKVTGANISLRITDEFMKAVREDKLFTLHFPIDSKKPICKQEVKARKLWETIISCARNTAEPGIVFWDRQHHYSTSSYYPGFKNVSTNPCSEIAMQGGDSCRLMAINLFSLVDHPFTSKAKLNSEKLYEVAYEGQRLMDNLVDLELEAIKNILSTIDQDPEPSHIKEVERRTWKLLYSFGKKGRRTGLGFTALADTLAALGLAFDSDKALKQVETMMRTKCSAEFDSSIDMAIERGKFEGFNTSIENKSGFIQMLRKEFPEHYKRMMRFGRRNISISTVAPTGTLSILSRTSSGIEPVFMLAYKRRRKIDSETKKTKPDFVDELGDSWEEFTIYHHKLKTWMQVSGKNDPTISPYYGATAPEIDWKKRIQLQAIVQKYTTHSISSTINLPSSTNTEKVSDIYMEAWELGLKGITVYREGSRSGVLVSTENKTKKNSPSSEVACEVCNSVEQLVNEAGCFTCKNCGMSYCS